MCLAADTFIPKPWAKPATHLPSLVLSCHHPAALYPSDFRRQQITFPTLPLTSGCRQLQVSGERPALFCFSLETRNQSPPAAALGGIRLGQASEGHWVATPGRRGKTEGTWHQRHWDCKREDEGEKGVNHPMCEKATQAQVVPIN